MIDFSKVLGLGIVFSSSLVKLPQIIKIISAQSSQGVSITSIMVEMLATSIFAGHARACNSPFLAYGESVLIFPQCVVLCILIQKMRKKQFILHILYSIFLVLLSQTSPKVLGKLFVFSAPLGIVSKIPQILMLHRRKSKGELSLITVFCYFAGSTARTYTSFKHISDPMVFWLFVCASLLNATILAQMLYYPKKNKD